MSFHVISLRLDRVWPNLLLAAGWLLFWVAVTAGENVPVVAILIGPMVMAIALFFRVRKTSLPRSPAKETVVKP